MRIFKDFPEAFGEIARDLREMGIHVENKMMQDKGGSFPTMELYNYGFTVLEPKLRHLKITRDWCDAEWQDRYAGIMGDGLNPGTSWIKRSDDHMIWADYLEVGGTPLPNGVLPDEHKEQNREPHDADNIDWEPELFAYTYSERFAMNQQVLRIIRELRRNPLSRQLYVSLWDPNHDCERLGRRRVPCSLGWHFLYRNDELAITYTMRSCDFVTHFHNDCWLSLKLLRLVAAAANIPAGRFSIFINSFHVYRKDVADVF